MQGNCRFFSCFGGREERGTAVWAVSRSAMEEVGVHGSRLLKLAKLLLVL